MTIANNVASKLFVAFVAAAMVFTLATPAKAATAEEMQAQIDALMAQIAALQGGDSADHAHSAACTFTRALTVGSQGEDVKCLQQYLTPTYFTNAGGATGYFGPVTQAAVAAWQTANGVMPAAGYFGPVSQAKYNAIAATDDSDDDSSDDDSDDDSSDDDDDSNDGPLSGEASLDSVEMSDGDGNDDVEEGSEDVQVAELEVNFEDGDAEITRIDLALEVASGNNGDDDPWEVFQDVSLWVDGDEVARKDASDEDEYLDEDDGSLRFSGLDIVAREDEDVTIVVAVSVNSSVDGVAAGDDEDWTVAVGGIRFTDADDVTTTETSTGDLVDITDATIAGDAAGVEFAIDVEGAGDELDLETSDEDPDSTTFSLDEDDNTEEAIFAFDLSAEDSDKDVALNEITITATVTNPGTTADDLDDLVNDFRLEIDGESFDAEAYTGATTTSIVFDIDGDVVIAADEVATAVLFADFENMDDASYEGSTIVAGVDASAIDAEGEESGEDLDVSGSSRVEGDTHTLRTEGVDVTLTDTSATSKANTDATTTDDEGVFEIEFDVTGFGGDIYVDDNTHNGTAENNTGVNYRVVDSNGNVIASTTGTSVGTLDSDAELESGRFVVEEGETISFTLTVEFDPATTGSYRVELYSLNWNDTNADADVQQTLSPSTDYDTGLLTI